MSIYLANKCNVSITVRLFTSQSNWGQKPISKSLSCINFFRFFMKTIFFYSTVLLVFFPLIIISPDVGFRSLINIRNVVVFPAPFAPSNTLIFNTSKIHMLITYLADRNTIVLSHEMWDDRLLYRFDAGSTFLFVFWIVERDLARE